MIHRYGNGTNDMDEYRNEHHPQSFPGGLPVPSLCSCAKHAPASEMV